MKSAVLVTTENNDTTEEWLKEEEISSFTLDGSEGGLFSGVFVPPPPRPLFLDDSATPDGLTTCDLCSWAWQRSTAFTTDNSIELPGQLGWVFSLIVVSIISAFLGAIVMIFVLHCKRLKHSNTAASNRQIPGEIPRDISLRPPIDTPNDKEQINSISHTSFPASQNMSNNSVWCWLSKKSSSNPSQLDNIACPPVENHYTHMEETYTGEALYAELDVESTIDREGSSSPAYQNSAYTDPDAQISSAPSSAYYSDLSVTPGNERAYEIVNLVAMNNWESERRPTSRLAAINENVSVPSDYI